MPRKYVRVRDSSGHHITVRGDVPKGHPRGVQEGQQVLKQDAVGPDGLPLPPKYRTELGTALPGSKKARETAQKRTQTASAAEPKNDDGQSADTTKEN